MILRDGYTRGHTPTAYEATYNQSANEKNFDLSLLRFRHQWENQFFIRKYNTWMSLTKDFPIEMGLGYCLDNPTDWGEQ